MLLKCHNWWVTEKTAGDLYKNAGSIRSLRKHLLQRTRRLDDVEELCMALNMVGEFMNRNPRYLEDLHVNGAAQYKEQDAFR